MAKQKGLFKVEGTLDDVTFYKKGDTFFIRNKGGVTKERFLTDPSFARTRENGSEFANVAASGKMIRNANAVLIKKAKDGSLTRRLMHVLAKVKNADTVSVRGKRNVYEGIGTTEGKAYLKNFDFNSYTPLQAVLQAPYALDIATGAVTITDLVPMDMMSYPLYASRVIFKTGFMNLDLETGDYNITYSPDVTLPIDMTMSSPVMTPTGVPTGTGTNFYFLLVEFSQEINGVFYSLNDETYNSLTLLEVN